ncbi:haloalkane dehalogenase [Fibrella sp. HMF5335]|uniref:Haloalkane dehalogenase n=1 Tax=Fibrella rubiginis TaxID=2817060 RepID=A0A939K6W3_9BACT|nr:haloalkane dehalogenase [Fibrella rubiginis]MBO0937990.1 haloalkane dehalogenase [Fibrella rubiginis]
MTILRTPAARFDKLPDYPFAPHYLNVGEDLHMHYVAEGNVDALPVLLLHGEPTWSYLYRKMIPILVEAGYRVVAPDLIGFGKSDKIAEAEAYSYQKHIDWLTSFVQQLDLQQITLVCQDWGGLLGLRLAAENESRFARICAANTGLPTGDQPPSEAFLQWQTFSQTIASLPIGQLISMGCTNKLPTNVIAAYDAPFPDETYKTAARVFPKLVPTSPNDPAASANRAAWQVLMRWQKPVLTCFSDGDPITAGGDKIMQKLIPGAAGQPHITLSGGHFLQEDAGKQWAEQIVAWMGKKG